MKTNVLLQIRERLKGNVISLIFPLSAEFTGELISIIEIVTPTWIKKRLTQLYAQKGELMDSLSGTDDETERTEYEQSLYEVRYELSLLQSLLYYINKTEQKV